jgi:hypothetical protein
LSKFAIVKAPAVLAVGAAPFAWTSFLRRATQPIRATARITGSSLEGDSRWLKEP